MSRPQHNELKSLILLAIPLVISRTIMASKTQFKRNERISIVKGTYEGKNGVFLGAAGKVSARVKVDGDTVQERTIRLTSIAKETVEITREEYNEMRDEMAMLTARIERLEINLARQGAWFRWN